MQDYFDGGATGQTTDAPMETNGGAVQPAVNGGDAMEDEILVRNDSDLSEEIMLTSISGSNRFGARMTSNAILLPNCKAR